LIKGAMQFGPVPAAAGGGFLVNLVSLGGTQSGNLRRRILFICFGNPRVADDQG
jgi:hypothetical protein